MYKHGKAIVCKDRNVASRRRRRRHQSHLLKWKGGESKKDDGRKKKVELKKTVNERASPSPSPVLPLENVDDGVAARRGSFFSQEYENQVQTTKYNSR